MFKYIEYTRVSGQFSDLTFKSKNEDTKVNFFSVDVVSVEGSESDIDKLISEQFSEIHCKIITQNEFRGLVKDSLQIKSINNIVKANIAKKYDVADEIAINRMPDDDVQLIAYLAYVEICKSDGDKLKTEVGYIKASALA